MRIITSLPLPPSCMSLERTLLDELFHSVLRDAEAYASLHSLHGVFQNPANDLDNTVDESSLAAICAHVGHTRFAPEE